MSDKKYKRPVRGVMPKRLWLEHRIQDLSNAINSRLVDFNEMEHSIEFVNEWIKEMEEHLKT